MTPCIFCDIVGGKAPATLVHQDETVIAVMALHPANPGHCLVLPRRHLESVEELDATTGAALMTVAGRIRRALRGAQFAEGGCNLLVNEGPATGQTIFHLHLHVIPRRLGDGLAVPDDGQLATRETLEKVAQRLRYFIA